MRYLNLIKRIVRHKIIYNIKMWIFNIKILFYKKNIIKVKKSIDKFENKYQGDKCFIIGNGPSLRVEDLEKLKKNKIKCFASNKIHSIFKETDWRPDFYILQDFTFKKKQLNILKDIMSFDMGECFFSYDFNKIIDRVRTKNPVNYFLKKPYSPFIKINDFSSNANLYIVDGATVTYTAIQLASYMGFKEIYLLGVDCSYSTTIDRDGKIVNDNNIKDYFSKIDDKSIKSISNVDAMIESYLVARKYASENNLFIANATRGGKLEVFERLELEDIIF